MQGLTPRQAAVYSFIKERIETTLICPTYQEIADYVGILKPQAHQSVTELVERGYLIRAQRNMRRSITLVLNCCPNCGHDLNSASAPHAEARADSNLRRTPSSARTNPAVIG